VSNSEGTFWSRIKQLWARRRPEIPEPLWQDCFARLPFLQRLSAPERARLKILAETLLADKGIRSAGGLELSDEIAVMIAAQAALPVLHLTLDLYDDMATIIVYPGAFLVPFSEVDQAGVVHEWEEPLAGEALHAGGAVVLSWEDSDAPGRHGQDSNVVIHEFAHKIDMANGTANGFPMLLADLHRGMSATEWQQAFSLAYQDFCDRVDGLERRLPAAFDPENPLDAEYYDTLAQALPLDPYAAHDPAEFFAVASEAFFVQPAPLALAYPTVYRLLARYYRQDPMAATVTRSGRGPAL